PCSGVAPRRRWLFRCASDTTTSVPDALIRRIAKTGTRSDMMERVPSLADHPYLSEVAAMPISDIKSAESIRAAAREFDSLGEREFLKKYQLSGGRHTYRGPDGTQQFYFLQVGWRRYEPEFIVRAAHTIEFPGAEPVREYEADFPESIL